MRTLTVYALAEVLKVFLVALAGLTAMMILVGVVQEAIQQGLPMGQVVRAMPFILPHALRVAVPVTLLLATTTAYCRMSSANEIVAIKSLGISPMVLLWPTFIAAFFLSLATVWLNDLAVSWGRNGLRQVVIEAIEEILYGALDTQHNYSSEGFNINVRSVEGRRLIRPTVTLVGHDGSAEMTITAREAELKADLASGVLKVLLWDYRITGGKGIKIEDPGVYEFLVPILDATRAQASAKTPSWLPLYQIPDEERSQRAVIDEMEQELAARAGFQLLSGDFEGVSGSEWGARLHDLETKYGQLHRLMTEPHRRWSNGFSCFCFAWVGVPMAIRMRNRDFLTSFFLCFLPILVVYYPLMVLGVAAAKNGTMPPYGVWDGNLMMLIWGSRLLYKVIRY